MDSSSAPKVSTLLEAALSSDIPPLVDDLDLSPLLAERQVLVGEMLNKCDSIWSGSQKQTLTVEYHIDILPEARPFMVRPNQAGPIARQEISKQVDRVLRQDVIELGQCEWVSPVVLAPKADGSRRSCIEYRKLNSISVRYSYPLFRMDDFFWLLGGLQHLFNTGCD